MMRWAVGLVRRALGTLLLLLLLISGAEVGVRLIEVRSRSSLTVGRAVSPWETMTAPSWTVRQELRPLTTLRIKSATGGASHAVQINSYGLRGAEVEVPKPPNIYRVLCLGDEQLLGAHLPDADHFCMHLRGFLQERTKLNVEVCNGGVPGACPLTEYLLLTHRLAALQPDLIVVAIQEGDLADNVRYRRYARYSVTGQPLICRHQTLSPKSRTAALAIWRQEFRLVDLALHWAGDAWKQRTEFDGISGSEQAVFDLARLRSDRRAIDHTLHPLAELSGWCRQSYATLCVLHVFDPTSDAAAATAPASLFSSSVQELATAQQFLLAEISRTDSTETSPRRTAWTAAEHQRFAVEFGERLVAQSSGPWNSPYFQPDRNSIAPVSLEVGDGNSPSRGPR